MARIAQSLKLTLRRLAQAPLFTFLTVLTLAVGIGAVSAVSSVLNGVLLKPLPFEGSDRLVAIWYRAPGVGAEELPQSPSLYLTFREQAKSFEETGIWQLDQVALTGVEAPQQLDAILMTEGVLPTFRVAPRLGRSFTAADVDPEAPRTVILTHAVHQRQFGGAPDVLGRLLTIDGNPREVIGVMAEDFRFPSAAPSLLMPLGFDRAELPFGRFGFRSAARLRDGVTLEQANAELTALIPGAIEAFPMPPGFSKAMMIEARLSTQLRLLKREVIGNVGQMLWVIFGTVALVLLVACANVANLFLARAEGRHQELAVKAALGASRRQVAEELLTESLLLSFVGALVGLGLAWLGLQLLLDLAPRGLPRLDEIALDGPVLAFTALVTLATGLLFGGLTVARLGSGGLSSALKDEGRGASLSSGRRRARNGLVVAQIALALVLLVGSGLLIRTFQAMRDVHPGFERPGELLTFRISVPTAEVAEPVAVMQLYQQVAEQLKALPGVSAVGLTSSVPMDNNNNFDPIFVEEQPASPDQIPPVRRMKFVTPGFFSTMGNALVAGRDVSWADLTERRPVAILTESLVRAYWPNAEAALGKRIRESPSGLWREVIGVAADVRDDGVEQDVTPIAYWPAIQENWWGEPLFAQRNMVVVVRSTRVGTPSFLAEVQRTVWSVHKNLPLASVRTQERILEQSMARTSFTVVMLAVAALAALLLGAVGTYGVTSYVAAQRTREIGVRMALGADRRDVTALVLRHGALLAALGVALGLAGSAFATRAVTRLLYGVSPLDPTTYGVMALTVSLVALAATYAPARRAARLDPVETLRR